jgi:glyoxylase-like metal-dependent hydrolase (beta-lactamase superfamily II)
MDMESFSIGRMRVHRIEEWAGAFLTPELLFAGFDEDAYQATRSAIDPATLDLETNAIQARIQSWVIEAGGRTILFDTGCGNHKTRPGIPVFDNLETDFLERLAAAGFAPEDIDLVVCSHLRVDHVGWNTMLVGGEWVPTFPNARYIFPEADVEYWNPANRHRFPDMIGESVNQGFFDDSVRPILDRSLADIVAGTVDLADGIRLDPNPGHTPGCQTLTLTDGSARAMFVGDVLHHPLQILNPGWNSIFCEDAAQARAARRHVLARAADEGAILVPAHFAGDHAVRITRTAAGFAPAPAFA